MGPRRLRIYSEVKNCLDYVLLFEYDFKLKFSVEHCCLLCVTHLMTFLCFPVNVPGSPSGTFFHTGPLKAKPPDPSHTHKKIGVVVPSVSQPESYPKISFIARKVSYLIHRPTKTNTTQNHKFFLTNTWLQIYTVSFFQQLKYKTKQNKTPNWI